MQTIECWQKGELIATHACSDELTSRDILKRFGLNERWTVCRYPKGAPQNVKTIQTELAADA